MATIGTKLVFIYKGVPETKFEAIKEGGLRTGIPCCSNC